jgi:hypothetical protein
MLEKEQYEPWLNANSGYWSQPLVAYADAAVWSGDPKVSIFKDTMKSTYYDGYKGPISTATGAVSADYVLIQMCAAVATGASTPEAAAVRSATSGDRAGSGRMVRRHCLQQTRSVCARERSDEAIHSFFPRRHGLLCFASLAMTVSCSLHRDNI